jgi:hypothetical protein
MRTFLWASFVIAIGLAGCGSSSNGPSMGTTIHNVLYEAVEQSREGDAVKVSKIECLQQKQGTEALSAHLETLTKSEVEKEGSATFHCAIARENELGSESALWELKIEANGDWKATSSLPPQVETFLSESFREELQKLQKENCPGQGCGNADGPTGGPSEYTGNLSTWHANTTGGKSPAEEPSTTSTQQTTPGSTEESNTTSSTPAGSGSSPGASGSETTSGCMPGTGPGQPDPQCQPRPGSPDYQPPSGSG